MNNFELIAGSFIGRDHLYTGTGIRKMLMGGENQDAFDFRIHDDRIIAVIADGCGSSKHSAVGAQRGVRLFTEIIDRNLLRASLGFTTVDLSNPKAFFARVKRDVVATLIEEVNRTGSNVSAIVKDYYLFTIVGLIITPKSTFIFSMGDGSYYINDTHTDLGPFLNNTPPYLGYCITGSPITESNPDYLDLEIVELKTIEVNNILIASDGIRFLQEAEEEKVPGLKRTVGPISQFWTNDFYYENPFHISRFLSLCGRDWITINWDDRKITEESSILRDDTTIISVRRKVIPASGGAN